MRLIARTFPAKLWQLVAPYWRSSERTRAWTLLVGIVGLMLFMIVIDVQINTWQRSFYDALQSRNVSELQNLLGLFCFLAALLVGAIVYKQYLQQMLEIEWRAWLTERYISAWLGDQTYYRLELEQREADNPDQRIAEDIRLFTAQSLGLGLGVLSSIVTVATFVNILWALSGALSFSLGSYALTIPGYMVWAAVLYALAGTLITHVFGRALIGTNYQHERVEADLRCYLVRLRDNAERIALYHGEASESRALMSRFQAIRLNWRDIMRIGKRLTFMTAGYSQLAFIFPFIVAAPRYLAGALTLGQLMQMAAAFNTLRAALSWFVDSYNALAAWKASVDRLLSFKESLDRHKSVTQAQPTLAAQARERAGFAVESLDIGLPNGTPLLRNVRFRLARGERVLIQGACGSGKTMLLRSLAGIWPHASGIVHWSRGTTALFLPQKPYLPLGTLKDVVCYPELPDRWSDEALANALTVVGLEPFVESLSQNANWSLLMSPGQQQRLALARALLVEPEWLFLDEATSSLDEDAEAEIYALFGRLLPHTAVVSIGHRPQLIELHDKQWIINDGALLTGALPLVQELKAVARSSG